MKSIFLFSGQGAQSQGMIKDLCAAYPVAQELIDKISTITGRDIPALLWDTEKSELAKSSNSQLAITTVSQVIVSILQSKGIEPAMVAGFSLGEYSALHAAGILAFEDMIKLVCKRGDIMQKASDALMNNSSDNPPGMAAVLGLPEKTVYDVFEQLHADDVFMANMNAPLQTVISGTDSGLKKAEADLKKAGAKRVIRLAVGGPFHSPLMQAGADEFAHVLDSVDFKNPILPFYSNVTGNIIKTGADARKNALLHLTKPVLWTTIENRFADSIQKESMSLIEVGPGTTLAGLWKNAGHIENCGICLPSDTVERIQLILENH